MQTTLLKPKAIHVEPLGGSRAKATLEPFERGYGHTLGNALRACSCRRWWLRANGSHDRRRVARIFGDRRRPGNVVHIMLN